MGRIATARFPLLMEHRGIRIQTTRFPRAALALREGLGGKPATERTWAHAHLPSDPRHRQPLLPQGAGLLVLAKALRATGLPRRFRPTPCRGSRIQRCRVSRARMGRRVCRERLRWRGGGTPRQRWALASLGFNGFTEMLHEMPAVGDLHRVRG